MQIERWIDVGSEEIQNQSFIKRGLKCGALECDALGHIFFRKGTEVVYIHDVIDGKTVGYRDPTRASN